MPPPPPRNVTIILFDLKVNSRSDAFHALSDVILYKQLSESKDLFTLYLVNAAKSLNLLEHEGIFYLNMPTNVGTVIEEIVSTESGDCDWLEALEVAVKEVKNRFEESEIITLKILFITDLCSFKTPSNEKLLTELVNDMKNTDIFLYVIGPPIHPPKIICSDKDVEKWMNNLEVDKSNANLKLMKDIVKRTPHTVVCNYNIGVHLYHSYKYCKGMQSWHVPLTIGSVLTMPVSTLRLTKREPPFRLKNMTTRSRDGDKWAYEDQQDVTIDFRDIVNGVVKHGKFVKIETDDRFKVKGPRSFRILGFTAAENVPEYFLQSDGSYLVIPKHDQSEEYLNFLYAFVNELADSNIYILVKRVYNKDTNPKFAALIPRKDFNLPCFIMCHLPYGDDIAHEYKEQDISSAPKVDIDKEVYNYLDNINVTSDSCQIKVPLAYPMMVYSNAFNIIDKVKEKIVGERYLEKKFDTSSGVPELNLENLKTEWPVRQLEPIKKEETPSSDFDEVKDFNFY